MQILKANSKYYKKALETAMRAIKKGQVLACPTDTVYGLICDTTNKKAVKKLFKIKKRFIEKALQSF